MKTNQEVYKFPRRCDITGKGMWEGYCLGDGEVYIKEKSDLLQHLHSMEIHIPSNLYTNDDPDQSSSDEQFLEYCYEEGIYYWTEWEDLDEDEWYESLNEDGSNAYAVNNDEH